MSSCPMITPGQQSAHDGPETERSDFNPADQKPHGQSKKDGQFLMLLKGLYKIVHRHSYLSSIQCFFAFNPFPAIS